MNEQEEEHQRASEGTLISHLLELRSRLLKMLVAILIVFVVLAPFAGDLFALVAAPLIDRLPGNGSMIATEVASPFLTPFKLTFVLAVFVAMPFVLYQLWAFVAPGLYSQERRFGIPLVVSSIALFYAGVAFAYFVVFPLIFGFFSSIEIGGVTMMTDIARYLDFVMALFLAFGLAFEVPIATILLVWVGFTTPEKLARKRPYVFLGAFVLGMLLTPPDMISQTLLAVPMYALFEIGIFMSRVLVPGHREVEAQQRTADADESRSA